MQEEIKGFKDAVINQLVKFERDLNGVTSMAGWIMLGLTNIMLLEFKQFEDKVREAQSNITRSKITSVRKDGELPEK